MRALLPALLLSCAAAGGNQYRIEIQADSALNVRGTVRLVWWNESNQPVTEIPLRCSGKIERAASDDGTRLEMKGASVMLRQPVSADAAVTVQIEFEAKSRGVYGYRILTGDWYPNAIPYRNGTYSVNQQQVDEYEVMVTAP